MNTAQFIRARFGDSKIYNLNLVYKIEKDGVYYKFYLIGGETFTINAGHVPAEIKKAMED